MTDINNLVNKYKARKQGPNGIPQAAVKPVSMKGRKIMGNEELTGAVHQLSGIIDLLAKGKKVDMSRYNDLLDVVFEVEMKIHALTKALCDKGIIEFSAVEEAKKQLEDEYSQHLEDAYDKQQNLFNVDRPCQNGDAVILGLAAEVDGVFSKELSVDKFFTPSLGSGDLIPVIESEMVGMKIGDVKTFKTLVDEELGKNTKYKLSPWVGKEISFTVTIYKVKEKRIPDLKKASEEPSPFIPVEVPAEA